MAKDLVYSFNGEEYYDIDDIREIIEKEDNIENRFIYVAEKIKYYHRNFISLIDFQDILQDLAYEEVSELPEYVDDLTKEKEEALKNLIIDWFDKNIEQPRFFIVKNIRITMLVEVLKENDIKEK